MSEIYKLIEAENPIMKVRLSGCSPDLDRDEIERKLIDSMEHYQGIGLSANQIGIMERVFVMYSDVKKRETIICFNPKVTIYSDTKILMDEGCLTYPGLWLKVKRSDNVGVQYEDKTGEIQYQSMLGLECRIFLHEYDHMEGTDFTQQVSKLKLKRAQKRLSKVQKRSKIVQNQ